MVRTRSLAKAEIASVNLERGVIGPQYTEVSIGVDQGTIWASLIAQLVKNLAAMQ